MKLGGLVILLLLASAAVHARHGAEGVSSPVRLSPRLNYTTELFGAVGGDDGIASELFGLAFASLDIALPAPAAIDSRTLHASTLWLHGDPLSDALGDVNGISNIAGVSTLRLFHAWFEQSAGGRTVRIGKFDVDEHFMVSEPASLFLNSGFGAMATATANMPLPTYPLAGLGALLDLRFDSGGGISLALFDGDVGTEDDERDGIDLGSSGVGGGVLAAEVHREHELPWGPGTMKAGGMLHTGEFDALAKPARRRGNGLVYVVLDQTLLQRHQRLIRAFARVSAAPFNGRNLVTYQFDAGLTIRDPLSRGGTEILGLAVLNTRFSDAAREDAGLVDASSETVMELTLLAPLRPNLTIQPALQWVWGNTLATGDDAVVAGLRLSLDL